MHTTKSIRRIDEIFQGQKIDLPNEAGVYAFWWIGAKAELMTANRHIVLKGPREKSVDVEYNDWWPPELVFPCLYVGKSTNIKKRFSLHIKRGSTGRLHHAQRGNQKAKPCTTSCQLRFGIEHIFPKEADPLSLIYGSVGFNTEQIFPQMQLLNDSSKKIVSLASGAHGSILIPSGNGVSESETQVCHQTYRYAGLSNYWLDDTSWRQVF